MRWASVAVVLPLALACCADEGINPVGGPPIGYASGSRLRARVRSSAPGARLLTSWYDKKLGTDCAFTATEDGALHCVPSGADVLFLDQLCEQPIAVVSASCNGGAPPPYASVTVRSEETCGGVARVYRVGDPVTLPRPHAYIGAGAAG